MTTLQEEFWKGEFGDSYIQRNSDPQHLASSLHLYSKVFRHTAQIGSVIEFGANIGINLIAIKKLIPKAKLSALEINKDATHELQKLGLEAVFHSSIFDFKIKHKWDFVFTQGVLIHLNPNRIIEAYRVLHESSKRYICIAEYYNPTPLGVTYRGHTDRLFKRDFAGELLDMYQDLKLVDYGFTYHRDVNFSQDDITWFLLEKT